MRTNLHSSRPQSDVDYEFDVDELKHLGNYLPDKPPNQNSNGQPIPKMNIFEPINTKTRISDNFKAGRKNSNKTNKSPKSNEPIYSSPTATTTHNDQTVEKLNPNIKNELKITIPNSDNQNKAAESNYQDTNEGLFLISNPKNETGSSLLIPASSSGLKAHQVKSNHKINDDEQTKSNFKTELNNEIKRRLSSINVPTKPNNNNNNNNNSSCIGGHCDQLSFTSLSSLSDTNESVEVVISKPKVKIDYIYPIEYSNTVHYIDESMGRPFYN